MDVNVLKHWHPMVGYDLQMALMPPLATPTPKTPHYVVACLKLGPWGVLTGKSRTDVRTASYGETMIRGTDIGPFIPHISTPHYLLPIHFLVSASKSEFGASSVRTPDGPVAVACLGIYNMNLNCWGPTWPPMPLGIVLAFTTHITGFTLGDLIAGVSMMVFDSMIQFAINRLFASSKVSNMFLRFPFLRGTLFRIYLTSDIFTSTTKGLGNLVGKCTIELVKNFIPTVCAQILGSPMGFAYWGGGYGQLDRALGPSTTRSFTDGVHDGIANLINGKEWDEYP